MEILRISLLGVTLTRPTPLYSITEKVDRALQLGSKKRCKILVMVTIRSHVGRVIVIDDVGAACVYAGCVPVFPFTSSCTQVPLPRLVELYKRFIFGWTDVAIFKCALSWLVDRG